MKENFQTHIAPRLFILKIFDESIFKKKLTSLLIEKETLGN